jgi:competence protein ComEC
MPDSMTFQFLDVGMGDSTLVQMRDANDKFDHLMLVDFGSRGTKYKTAYKDALAYLTNTIDKNSLDRKSKTPYVDCLVITHSDGDHCNKIEELLLAKFPGYPKDKLQFGQLRFSGREKEYKGLLDKLALVLPKKGVKELPDAYHSPILPGKAVEPFLEVGGIRVYILSANWETIDSPKNEKSIVLAFKLDKRTVILSGDAEKETEERVIQVFGANFLDSMGLKVGHHGSYHSSCPEWVKAVSPKAIFASGDAVWLHPYCETICRFIEHGSLDKLALKNVYYVCGGGPPAAYYSNPTKEAICTNLNYYVKSKTENLVTYDDLGKPLKFIGNDGEMSGVQWELQITAGAPYTIAPTALTHPDVGQAIPAPWKCPKNKMPAEPACEMLTGVRSRESPLGM